MFRYIRKSRFTKVFAMVLLVSFLAELMQPAQLYALTGGPSQPEMAGFTPSVQTIWWTCSAVISITLYPS